MASLSPTLQALSPLESAVVTIIEAACQHHESVDRDGLIDTPRRVSKAWLAMAAAQTPLARSFSTNSVESASASPSDVIRSALFDEPGVERALGFVLVKDIAFACLNRETLLPMHGKCHVAYVPKDGTIIGLSKLSRVVSSVCSRSLLSPRQLCRSVMDMIGEFSGGVAVVACSNYGVVGGRRGQSFGDVLFDEMLAMCGVDAGEVVDVDDVVDVDVDVVGVEVVGDDDRRHERIVGAVGALLEGIGEDATSGESVRSARSYASWFLEATSGYYRGVGDGVGELVGDCEGDCEGCEGEMVVVVPFTSQCEHHLLPFEGKVGVMLVGGKGVARTKVRFICLAHAHARARDSSSLSSSPSSLSLLLGRGGLRVSRVAVFEAAAGAGAADAADWRGAVGAVPGGLRARGGGRRLSAFVYDCAGGAAV